MRWFMLTLTLVVVAASCSTDGADRTAEESEAPGSLPLADEGTLDDAQRGPAPKITICHRTNSSSNPWVAITVSANAIGGHVNHAEDVIPPTSSFPGQNYPSDVVDEDCNPIQSTTTTSSTTTVPSSSTSVVTTTTEGPVESSTTVQATSTTEGPVESSTTVQATSTTGGPVESTTTVSTTSIPVATTTTPAAPSTTANPATALPTSTTSPSTDVDSGGAERPDGSGGPNTGTGSGSAVQPDSVGGGEAPSVGAEQLARTGGSTGLAVVALALLVLGAVLLTGSHRARRRHMTH